MQPRLVRPKVGRAHASTGPPKVFASKGATGQKKGNGVSGLDEGLGAEVRVDVAEGVGGAKSGVAVGRDGAKEVGVGGARYCVPVGGEEVEGEEDTAAAEVGCAQNSVAVGGAEGDAALDSE